jgi:hypothetical protein
MNLLERLKGFVPVSLVCDNLENFVKAIEYLEITHQMLIDSGCELEVLDEIEALLEKFK